MFAAVQAEHDKRNDAVSVLAGRDESPRRDGLARRADAYLELAATTAASSRAVQRRDIERFVAFMEQVECTDARERWTPRLAAAYRDVAYATQHMRVSEEDLEAVLNERAGEA